MQKNKKGDESPSFKTGQVRSYPDTRGCEIRPDETFRGLAHQKPVRTGQKRTPPVTPAQSIP